MLQRNKGGILNVGSIAGFQPAPKSATYCATKAFVMTFSESLHGELKGTPVKVSVLCPGLTRTEFQDTAAYDASTAPDFLWQTAAVVVDVALAGLAKNKAVVVPGALNRSVAAFSSAAPRALVRRVAAVVQSRQKAGVE
jgi:short-subunit dehydrogenase